MCGSHSACCASQALERGMHANLPGLAHWAGRLKAWSSISQLLRVSACLWEALRYNARVTGGFSRISGLWQFQVMKWQIFLESKRQAVIETRLCSSCMPSISCLYSWPPLLSYSQDCSASPDYVCWVKTCHMLCRRCFPSHETLPPKWYRHVLRLCMTALPSVQVLLTPVRTCLLSWCRCQSLSANPGKQKLALLL